MRWLNNVKTAVLMSAMMGLVMLIGYFIGGTQGLTMAFVLGAGMNFFAYFFSDKIAMMAMGGQEVAPEELPWLHDMVERLATRAGLPKPRVYVCPQAAPNAFATGRNPRNAAVAVTQGMLRNFPQQEIEGVLAHELGHVKHRDVLISTIAAVLAGAISYLGYMAMWFGGGRDRDNPLGAVGAIAMIILGPIAAMLIQAAISRQREYAADSYGGELCGDPRKLASALMRLQAANDRIPLPVNPAFNNMFIVEPLNAAAGGIGGLFATHPPIEQRIALLQQQAQALR